MPQAQRDFNLTCDAQVELGAADKPAKVSILAYSGGLMKVPGWGTVCIDLSGLVLPASANLLADHDSKLPGVLGAGVPSVRGGKLYIDGTLSKVSEAAEKIVAMHKDGVTWGASVGMVPSDTYTLRPNERRTINGQQITGPCLVVASGRLREVSITSIGCDPTASVAIAASNSSLKGFTMKFADWLWSKGFNPEQVTDQQKPVLQAQYDAEQVPPAEEPKETIEASATTEQPDPIEEMRQRAAAEQTRIHAIQRICAGGHADLCAAAIADGRDPRDVELEVLRASRKPTRTEDATRTPGNVLECAFSRAVGLGSKIVEASYDDQTLSAADNLRGFGLQALLIASAQQGGYSGRTDSGAFRSHGTLREILQASFSQALVSNILSNVANKTILEAFNHVEDSWRQIATIGTVNDFKQHTRVRLTGDMVYEELSETGEIRHGKLADETRTISAKTYAKMLALTRNDIINDDLGALAGAQVKLGRGAALKLNSVFWTKFQAELTELGAAVFSSGNANLVTGTTYALTANDPIASLAKAEQTFLDQTDPDGDPLGIMPQTLLVPTALWAKARALMQSTEITTGGGNAKDKVPTVNIYAGRYTPVVSSYLKDSATAWYLIANPADMPLIEVAFLDGKQAPTVESADVDFNKLGIQMRGYHDFGVAFMEPKAAVKVTGASA